MNRGTSETRVTLAELGPPGDNGAVSILLVLLFAGSGAAALMYEVVWQQLLQLVIGSSTISLAVLLGTFMGGMCLGSLAAPRLLRRNSHPLLVYAGLEGGIGLMGVLLPLALPLVSRLYVAVGGVGPVGVVMRAIVAGVCLLPPTMAMGATLPVMARYLEQRRSGRVSLGYFYAGNLAGAVFGCLLAGFYLLRVFDMVVTSGVAVALNLGVAGAAWTLSQRDAALPEAAASSQLDRPTPSAAGGLPPSTVFIVLALSGFCALAGEVVWTRLLALSFGATVYTFSIVLAIFLVGLGIGSTAGAAIGGRVSPRWGLGLCQMAAAASVVWSAWMLARWLPYLPASAVEGANIWTVFRTDGLRGLAAIFPAPLFWGASFSIGLSALASRQEDQAGLVGRLSAANTLGAIAGALLTALVLIPRLGTQHAQQVMAVLSVLAGAVALNPRGVSRRVRVGVVGLGAVVGGLIGLIPPLPGIVVAYGRHAAAWTSKAHEIIYVGEGMHASIAVSKTEDGVLNYHNAGKVQASSEPADMRLQRMLGHLTTLVPAKPKKVLVIGCGAGVTAGAVSVNPNVESVTIVDIEPLVPQTAGRFMGGVNHDVIRNPKVHVVADDARHYLQTTTERFDAITSDPLDPWVKGAATLYTKEFFETARQHLNPGGVMTLYVQLFESSPAAVKSEMATFFEAFPEALVFGNLFDGHAIDTVLLGTAEPPQIWVDEIETMLRSSHLAPVDSSLVQAGIYGAVELFGNYAGRARDLKGWVSDAEVNHDRDLRLQYLAGLGLNLHVGDEIYRDLLSYRTYPDDLFVASESTVDRLKLVLDGVRE